MFVCVSVYAFRYFVYLCECSCEHIVEKLVLFSVATHTSFSHYVRFLFQFISTHFNTRLYVTLVTRSFRHLKITFQHLLFFFFKANTFHLSISLSFSYSPRLWFPISPSLYLLTSLLKQLTTTIFSKSQFTKTILQLYTRIAWLALGERYNLTLYLYMCNCFTHVTDGGLTSFLIHIEYNGIRWHFSVCVFIYINIYTYVFLYILPILSTIELCVWSLQILLIFQKMFFVYFTVFLASFCCFWFRFRFSFRFRFRFSFVFEVGSSWRQLEIVCFLN